MEPELLARLNSREEDNFLLEGKGIQMIFGGEIHWFCRLVFNVQELSQVSWFYHLTVRRWDSQIPRSLLGAEVRMVFKCGVAGY